MNREFISGGGMSWACCDVMQTQRGVVMATSALFPSLLHFNPSYIEHVGSQLEDAQSLCLKECLDGILVGEVMSRWHAKTYI